eukprot:gene9641-19483_t
MAILQRSIARVEPSGADRGALWRNGRFGAGRRRAAPVRAATRSGGGQGAGGAAARRAFADCFDEGSAVAAVCPTTPFVRGVWARPRGGVAFSGPPIVSFVSLPLRTHTRDPSRAPPVPAHGGVWELRIVFPDQYPAVPPAVSFRPNAIFHCNVSASGEVCIDLIGTGYCPATRVAEMLRAVVTLLACPDPARASNLAALTAMRKKTYDKRARQLVQCSSLHRPEWVAAVRLRQQRRRQQRDGGGEGEDGRAGAAERI